MALNLRERFGPKEPDSRRLLAQDFEFAPSNYPPLRDFTVERNELELLERPLAVTRAWVLARGMEGLQLEFALCLDGPAAAFELLYQRASAFQRELPENRITDVSRGAGIGDAGIAWQWNDREPDGVLGFVRHNLLVFMKGAFERLQVFARELDTDLSKLETRAQYADSPHPLFDAAARRVTLETTAGSRLDLGTPPGGDSKYFFVAGGGSVNRDAHDPGHFYYRAGLEKGDYTIVAYRVGRGLLPDRQTLPVRIS